MTEVYRTVPPVLELYYRVGEEEELRLVPFYLYHDVDISYCTVISVTIFVMRLYTARKKSTYTVSFFLSIYFCDIKIECRLK